MQGDFERGFAAYSSGDFTTALREWRPLAEQGDGRAQLSLSSMYFTGRGVPKNDEEAAKWCRLAAEQGDPSAQLHLGWMCLKGLGVTKDEGEGVEWIRRAAEQGFDRAQYSLGWLYYEGWGVPKDDLEAYRCAHLAASNGNADGAQLRELIGQRMTPEHLLEAQRFG